MFKKYLKVTSLLLICVAAGALLYSKVTVDYRKDREGIYLLKGQSGDWLNLTDDLYPEQTDRLLWGIALPELKNAKTRPTCIPLDKACTNFEWNEDSGKGFIKTLYPDGRKLIISLGRYISSTGKPVSGLFIGGGLPPGDPDYDASNSNETGMSYFEGGRYFHIWCKVNEGIQDAVGKTLLPSSWEFLSSKILESSGSDLTIISKHQTLVNNVPVHIERTMFYQTGDTFLTFTTQLKNIGNSPTSLMYMYGDEPWLGNFYKFSKGNVGWFEDGLVTTEMQIDTSKHNYVGMFDYGNPLAGESHTHTGKANFLEWEPASRPDMAYFSNNFGSIAPLEQKVPLASYKNRVISLQWGPKILNPGETLTFTLKVGMAGNDPKTGLPVIPETQLY